MKWIDLKWHELTWNYLNWPVITWLEMTWLELKNTELKWIDLHTVLSWTQVHPAQREMTYKKNCTSCAQLYPVHSFILHIISYMFIQCTGPSWAEMREMHKKGAKCTKREQNAQKVSKVHKEWASRWQTYRTAACASRSKKRFSIAAYFQSLSRQGTENLTAS